MQDNVLLLSQRKISKLVAYCISYELEDVIAEVTSAYRVDASDFSSLEFSRRAYKLARHSSGSPSLARRLTPQPKSARVLQQDYDLFFPVFNSPYELYSLAVVPNWRQRCRNAACFLIETGTDKLPSYLIEFLSEFDHVFVGTQYGAEELAKVINSPCTSLPIAVDVLRFAPAPNQSRPIEVCNIGRRSAITHDALLQHADRHQLFYYYDTVAASGADRKDRTFRVDSAQEHRKMLATMLKNSRFFLANKGHIDRPELVRGREEISGRFYEGAAAGVVMIGEPPHSEDFAQQFDWPDAVIHVPFDSPDIGNLLLDLNADSDRLDAARRNNVREAARRHDWLHRIQAVFETLDLKPTDKMQERARQLEQIADKA